tara:strand:- start:48 stop:698 length:651 start_codon:yes stop_codon:yes gene_type:complete
MIIIGLTGKIGSGKTTTAKIIKDLGYSVFDCDESAQKILKESQTVLKIKRMFNNKIRNLITSNHINTNLLGNYVFSKPKDLAQLESFIHPKIKKKEKFFLFKNSISRKKIVFLDIPLMFRRENFLRCDYIVNLIVSDKIQEQRVLMRPGMNINKFKNILNQQFYKEFKYNKFKSININTGGGMYKVRKEIVKFLKKIKNKKKRRVWPKLYYLYNKT